MHFKVRAVKPEMSGWKEIEANTFEDAIQLLHDDNVPGGSFASIRYTHHPEEGSRYDIFFATFEVEGIEGEYVSRIFKTGIWRKGGVATEKSELKDIANKLGWTKSAEDLLGEGWTGEESWDAARERKWGTR